VSEDEVRPEVVQALIEAHNAEEPAVALAAVEIESSPTDTEKEQARRHILIERSADRHKTTGLDDESS
jgi:hypothetical protein